MRKEAEGGVEGERKGAMQGVEDGRCSAQTERHNAEMLRIRPTAGLIGAQCRAMRRGWFKRWQAQRQRHLRSLAPVLR